MNKLHFQKDWPFLKKEKKKKEINKMPEAVLFQQNTLIISRVVPNDMSFVL